MGDTAKRRSYKVVGGPNDGDIVDNVADDQTESVRATAEADYLEIVPDESGKSDVLDAPVDEPRVPAEPRGPRGKVTVGEPKAIKGGLFDLDVGDAGAEPDFVDDPDQESPRGLMLTGEPEVLKGRGLGEFDRAGLNIGNAELKPEMNVVDVGEEDPNELLAYEADTDRLAEAQRHVNSPAWSSAGQPGDFRLPTDWLNVASPETPYSPEDQWLDRPDPRSFEGAIEQQLTGTLDAPSSAAGVDRAVLEPLMRGFSKTALLGGSDEAAGGIAALAGNDLGDSIDLERAQNEYQKNAHPVPTALGNVAGYAPWLAAQPASALGRFGFNTLAALAEGGLSSDSDDLGQTASDAGWNALYGGLGALGGEALAAGGGKLRGVGVAQRRASAAPGTAAQLEAVRKRYGVNYMERGLDQAFDDLGLASRPWLQSAAGVNERIGPREGPGMFNKAGEEMGAAIDAAGAQGARGDWDRVQQGIDQQAADITAGVPGPAKPARKQAQALYDVAEELPATTYQMVGNPYDLDVAVKQQAAPALPRELQAQKMHFQEHGKYPEGVTMAPRDERVANAYRGGAKSLADELNQTMQSAGPELYDQFAKNRDRYQDLAQFEQMSGEQASRVKGAQALRNPFNYARSAGGAAAGAGISTLAGLGPWPGAIGGTVLGGALGQKYGQDAFGLGLQGAGNLMRGAGAVGSTMARSMGPQGSRDTPNVAEAAMKALEGNRRALDHYSPRFQEAMAQPDPKAAVSALVVELIQTDPEFRERVLPILRGQAVQQR